MTITASNEWTVSTGLTTEVRACTRRREFATRAAAIRCVRRPPSSARPARSFVTTGRPPAKVSFASTAVRVKRFFTFAIQLRSAPPRTATTSLTFVFGSAIRARATAVCT